MLEEIEIVCPHCGEAFPLSVDTSEGNFSTIIDCAVCCRPIQVNANCRPGEVSDVDVRPI